MSKLPRIAEPCERVCVARRRLPEDVTGFTRELHAALTALRGTLPEPVDWMAYDDALEARVWTEPGEIQELVAIWELPAEEERVAGEPSHMVRLVAVGSCAHAELLVRFGCWPSSDDRVPTLFAELRLGDPDGTSGASEPAAVDSQAALEVLASAFDAAWGVVEPAGWPWPARTDRLLSDVGRVTMVGDGLIVPLDEVRHDRREAGVMLYVDEEPHGGWLPQRVEAVRMVVRRAVCPPTGAREPEPQQHREPARSLEPIAELAGTAPAKPASGAQPALPFRPGTPGGAPPRAGSLEPVGPLGGTAMAAPGVGQGPALPFQRAPASGPLPTSGPLEKHPALGGTPAAPGLHEGVDEEPALTLEQYASLCAECALWPDDCDAIRARFGLDAAAQQRLDLRFRKWLAEDAALHGRFYGLFVRYREWLRENR
jgi:hypothetical protein